MPLKKKDQPKRDSAKRAHEVKDRLKEEMDFTDEEFEAGVAEQGEISEICIDTLKAYLKKTKKDLKKVKVAKEEEEMTDETIAEGTENEATLKAGSKHVDTKAGLVSSIVAQMMLMNKGDLTKWFDQAQATIGHEADSIPAGAAAKNKASISAKGVAKEDVEALFDGEDLTEDFKAKTVTIFEAAVEAAAGIRFIEIQEELEGQLKTKLDEAYDAIEKDFQSKVDAYLDYMAEEWMKANEIAIESTLRNELTEDFIKGLKDLFVEHYIDVPEDKVNVLEDMAAKLVELEGKLDEVITENHSLKETVEASTKKDIFSEVSEGLAATQVEKLRTLVEGIDDEGSVEVYKTKLTQIKESYFKTPKAPKVESNILTEEVVVEDNGQPVVKLDPIMSQYTAAIGRSAKY